MSLSRDPRVIIYVVSVAIALIILAPVPTEEGLDSRLKYGLDLEGGSWLQLQLQGAIVELDCDAIKILEKQFQSAGYSVEEILRRGDSYVISIAGRAPSTLPEDLGYPGAKTAPMGNSTKVTIAGEPEYVIVGYLEDQLETDVTIVGVEPLRYEIRTEVTRESLNALLEDVGGSVAQGEDAFVEGVIPETVDETKEVLDKKLNRLGLQDIKVRVVGNRFILIDMAGVNVADAEEIVGKPGKFEIRIQTDDNETAHVLYGNDIVAVELPKADREGMVGVPFTLSVEGAQVLRKMAIDVGATKNPQLHELSMHLDKDVIFSAPLAYELADSLEKSPIRNMVAEVGSGDEGFKQAKELYIHLREGALPVNVKIIGSGQVTAGLGEQFKRQVAIAGMLSILAVGLVVFLRYRERRIVLPMVATSTSEVIMMLGVWALAGWQLDLASIAGIIAVIGTGVDQLVIITDELLYEGRLPSGKVYLARLSRAFFIILAAAATVVFAMLPLLKMGFGALTGFALIIIIGVLIGVFIARPAYGRIIGEILRED